MPYCMHEKKREVRLTDYFLVQRVSKRGVKVDYNPPWGPVGHVLVVRTSRAGQKADGLLGEGEFLPRGFVSAVSNNGEGGRLQKGKGGQV